MGLCLSAIEMFVKLLIGIAVAGWHKGRLLSLLLVIIGSDLGSIQCKASVTIFYARPRNSKQIQNCYNVIFF